MFMSAYHMCICKMHKYHIYFKYIDKYTEILY